MEVCGITGWIRCEPCVGLSSSHRRIGRLSGGELAVYFFGRTRSSLVTMLPEVCELAQQVAWKEDASPWTPADKASHDFLVKALRSLTPDVAVVSEKSESSADCTAEAIVLADQSA